MARDPSTCWSACPPICRSFLSVSGTRPHNRIYGRKAVFKGGEVPSFRSSASFGKRQEFAAIAELLKRNYDVYLTLVDDQQIDCMVRLGREPINPRVRYAPTAT